MILYVTFLSLAYIIRHEWLLSYCIHDPTPIRNYLIFRYFITLSKLKKAILNQNIGKELHYRAKTEVIFVVRHVPKYKNKYHPNSPGAVNTKLRDNFIFSSSKPHPGPLYWQGRPNHPASPDHYPWQWRVYMGRNRKWSGKIRRASI